MGTYVKYWDCCDSETRTEAWEPSECPFCTQAPPAAVPEGYALVPVEPSRDAVANAIWLATKAYGSLDHDRPSLSAEPRPLQKLIYEQADAAIIAMLAAPQPQASPQASAEDDLQSFEAIHVRADVRADVRGDPAAWIYEVRFDGTCGKTPTDWRVYSVYHKKSHAESHLKMMGDGLVGRIVPLYRSPVGLPPELEMPDAQDFESGEDFVGAMGWYGGWNACLRRIKAQLGVGK